MDTIGQRRTSIPCSSGNVAATAEEARSCGDAGKNQETTAEKRTRSSGVKKDNARPEEAAIRSPQTPEMESKNWSSFLTKNSDGVVMDFEADGYTSDSRLANAWDQDQEMELEETPLRSPEEGGVVSSRRTVPHHCMEVKWDRAMASTCFVSGPPFREVVNNREESCFDDILGGNLEDVSDLLKEDVGMVVSEQEGDMRRNEMEREKANRSFAAEGSTDRLSCFPISLILGDESIEADNRNSDEHSWDEQHFSLSWLWEEGDDTRNERSRSRSDPESSLAMAAWLLS